MPEPQNTADANFTAARAAATTADNSAWMNEQLAQSGQQPAAPAAPTDANPVDAMPSSTFGRMAAMAGQLLHAPAPQGTLTRRILGQGPAQDILSGAESQAADTLQSVPNLALIASSGALGTIPKLAEYGGSRLLSAWFGLSLGKALWTQYGQYRQAINNEGGLGPQSRELLGRMLVTAGLGIKSAQHALTTPGTTFPAPGAESSPAASPEGTLVVPEASTTPASAPADTAGLTDVEAGSKGSPEPSTAAPAATAPVAATPAMDPFEGALRVNLKYIDAEQSVKETIANINQLNSERMASSRSGQSHAVTVEGAKGALSVEQALALEDGAPLRPEEMVALRDIRDAAAAHVDDLAQRTLNGELGASMQLKNAFAIAADLEAKREASSRTIAQSLESHKIPSDATRPALAASDIADLAEKFTGSVDIDPQTLAARLVTLRTPEAKQTFMSQVISAAKTGGDMAYEAWINGLISSAVVPKTMGDLAATFMSIPERWLASKMPSATVADGEASAKVSGIVAGWGDGLRAAAKIWGLGSDPVSVLGDRVPEITAANANIDPDSYLGRAVDLLGSAVRMPGRALDTVSAFAKAVNYRMELRAQAFREASAEGLEGDALASRMAEIEATPPASIKVAADQASLVNSFQNELGPVASSFAKAMDLTPGGRVVMPLMQVPINISKYGFQRLFPLSLASPQNWSDIREGGAPRDLALAKITAGALTTATFATLAASGYITGSGPDNPELKRQLQATSWRPNSVKIGDNYYQISRVMGPFGPIMDAISDFVGMLGQMPEHKVAEVATALALATSEGMGRQSYLTGPAQVLDAIVDPEKGAKTYVPDMVSSVVPTIVRREARSLDPTVRRINSLLDEIKAGIPGWSSTLPPSRNIFGEPIMYPPSIGPEMISPAYVSKDAHDLVADEIAKQQVPLTMPPQVLFGSRPPDVRLNPQSVKEGVQLSPEQYDLFVRLAGNELKGASGLGMKDALAQLIQSPSYQRLSDGPDGSKALEIQKVVTAYRAAAKAELIKQDPSLQMALQQKVINKVQSLRPQPFPAPSFPAIPSPAPSGSGGIRIGGLEVSGRTQ